MGNQCSDSISLGISSALNAIGPKSSHPPDLSPPNSQSKTISRNDDLEPSSTVSEDNKSHSRGSQDNPALLNQIMENDEYLHVLNGFSGTPSIITNIMERPPPKRDPRSSVGEQERFYLQPKQFHKRPNWKCWRRPLKQLTLFFSLCLAVWFYVPFPLFIAPTGLEILDFTPRPWSCNNVGFAGGGPWNLIGIDIRFGRMTFGQAKGLDLAWNWIAGRGLQFVLALVAYRVFISALMRTAEVTYVPYELFTSLALFSTKTDALWHLTQGFKSLPGWRFKFMIGWLLFSTGYLSIFPGLMDVISGYEAAYVSVLVLPNKTTLTLDGLRTFEGLLYNVVCEGQDADPRTCLQNYYQFYDDTLNASYSAVQEWLELDAPHNNSRPLFYAELPENFNCVAEQNVYEWGFSSEWVLIAGCLNSFWLFGLWLLWLDADTQSQFSKKGRRMGTYRAIVDIAEAIKEDLGDDLAAYSERELSNALRQQAKIKYYVTEPKDGIFAHIGLSSRRSDRVQLNWDMTYR